MCVSLELGVGGMPIIGGRRGLMPVFFRVAGTVAPLLERPMHQEEFLVVQAGGHVLLKSTR